MRLIYIDDEILALQAMKKVLDDFSIVTSYEMFNNPYDALSYLKVNTIDLALVDIQMPGINGLEFAKLLKINNENIEILFVTGNDEYAMEAYKLDAIGYILKPYNNEDIYKKIILAKRLRDSRNPHVNNNRVSFRTFGNFDMFIDNKLVVFNWPKTKEFLAVLVDKKGSFVSTNEMLAYLFEDQKITESIKSYIRTLKANLKTILVNNKVEDIIIFTKNGCAIECDKVTCDYYNYLKNTNDTKKMFRGEYMNNYSWAEDTLAKLLQD